LLRQPSSRERLRLPRPPVPTAQYVPAVAAGGLLFVSGQDPEVGGQLVYRGQVGREVSWRQGRAALRLATLNALSVAQAALGSLDGARRCVAFGCFVDMAGGAPTLELCRDALALVDRAFGPAAPPVVWLRPARGLAGGMPVEVELILELR
jgi:enamine deaminase RidA (YjgF/YER057c/UK114 family)